MKIIINKFLPIGKKFFAINLFGVLFAKGKCDIYTINHEKIHSRQMKEMLYVFFYVWYVIEWLLKFVKHKNYYKAYASISFEREAYKNQYDLEYLANRQFWDFVKYL